MSITTALKARREAIADREAGFTLIELLVVVLIIGILAAIAIPVYLGVQNSAKDAGVKSDLVNAKTALTAIAADNAGAVVTSVLQGGTTPATYTATAGSTTGWSGNKDLVTYGWSKSANTSTLTFVAGGTTGTNANKWCVVGLGATGKKFAITSGTSAQDALTTGTGCPTVY